MYFQVDFLKNTINTSVKVLWLGMWLLEWRQWQKGDFVDTHNIKLQIAKYLVGNYLFWSLHIQNYCFQANMLKLCYHLSNVLPLRSEEADLDPVLLLKREYAWCFIGAAT